METSACSGAITAQWGRPVLPNASSHLTCNPQYCMYSWPGEQKQWIKMAEWHDFWKSLEARRSSQWVSVQANCWSVIPSTLTKWPHSSKCFPRLDILMQGSASPPIPHTLAKQQHHHDIVSSDNDGKTLDTQQLIHKVNLCLVADRKQWCCEIAL